ncbi:MAG: aspartate aminotransferase family protein [Halieaceae bacterium]|jgi:putrescine aminotransferase|nr:aspartate aminotransferase family protein [Halieaceae bacterium]
MKNKPSDKKKDLLKRYGYRFGEMRLRTMKHLGMDVIETERSGCYSRDIDGELILDALALQGVFNLGRRHPVIVEALKEGIETLDMGNNFFMSEQRLQLAEKLAETTPCDVDCFFLSSTGSEAVELALKVARGFTSRPGIISANECYHGVTGFALSTNSNPDYTAPFEPLIPGFSHVPFGSIDALSAEISDSTAAVIFEPMISEAGLLIPPADYFSEVRALCDAHDSLLIIDEVVTGLGRTGKFWGIEHFDGANPDIMISGKGLSAGMYPMAATMMTEEVADFFLAYPFSHYSSTGGSDLGCVVASAMIDIVNTPAFLEQVNLKGARLAAGYEELLNSYPETLASYGQIGLNTVLRLADDSGGFRMNHYLAEAGVFALLATNSTAAIRIQPPLIVSDSEIDLILNALDGAFGRMR